MRIHFFNRRLERAFTRLPVKPFYILDATCNPDLESIDNGDYEGQNRYKERVVYSCHKGYEIRGNSERVCRSNRMWSSPAPTCVGKLKIDKFSSDQYSDINMSLYLF